MTMNTRRKRQHEKELAESNAALYTDCPVPHCEATSGVWCGANTLGPWMHERRYKKALDTHS